MDKHNEQPTQASKITGSREIDGFRELLSPTAQRIYDTRLRSVVMEINICETPEKIPRDKWGRMYFHQFPGPYTGLLSPVVVMPKAQDVQYRREIRLCRFLTKTAPCISEEDQRPDPKCVQAFAEAINRLATARLIDYGCLADAVYLPIHSNEVSGVLRRCALCFYVFGDTFTQHNDSDWNNVVNTYLGTEIAVKEGHLGDGNWERLLVQPQSIDAEIEAQVQTLIAQYKRPGEVLLGTKQRNWIEKFSIPGAVMQEDTAASYTAGLYGIMTTVGSVRIIWTEDADRCQVVPAGLLT